MFILSSPKSTKSLEVSAISVIPRWESRTSIYSVGLEGSEAGLKARVWLKIQNLDWPPGPSARNSWPRPWEQFPQLTFKAPGQSSLLLTEFWWTVWVNAGHGDLWPNLLSLENTLLERASAGACWPGEQFVATLGTDVETRPEVVPVDLAPSHLAEHSSSQNWYQMFDNVPSPHIMSRQIYSWHEIYACHEIPLMLPTSLRKLDRLNSLKTTSPIKN